VTVMRAVALFQRVVLQGLSPETKRWYRCRLSLIAEALGETRTLGDIAEMDLIHLRERWESKGLSPDTLHGYLRVLRRLFRWLHKCDMLPSDLTREIPLPRLPKRGRRGISDLHAEMILEEAKRSSVRDYALLLVFASTSARRSGVAGLKLSDLRVDEPEPFCRQVQVIEKGGKERTVVMDDLTLAALRAWLAVRPVGCEFVFVTKKGGALRPSSVSEVIDRYKRRLGIVGRCSPHQWRHRWFRRLLSNRMPLALVAQLGGHENTTVTYQFYGQFAVDELQDAFDKYYNG
jgi:site-specific recombinase XerD